MDLRVSLVTLLATGLCNAAEPPSPAAAPLVRVSLLSDTSAVAAGQPFRVAVRFDIAPGWHLYWENPGESGMATRVSFQLPAGFQAGATRYPGPERFQQPGGVVIYGYEHQAALFAEVTPPSAPQAGGSVQIQSRISWLACSSESCVPGKADKTLTVQVVQAGQQLQRNPDWPAKQQGLLPRPLAELKGARVTWSGGGLLRGGPALRITIPEATGTEFFPARAAEQGLSGQAVERDGKGFAVRLNFRDAAAARVAPGVLKVSRDAETAYYQIEGAS